MVGYKLVLQHASKAVLQPDRIPFLGKFPYINGLIRVANEYVNILIWSYLGPA